MAGHSHSANIKHRKDRQDSARSQLFLRLRKKLEAIIREEHGVNEKSLVIARENQFPKSKLFDIWEKIKLEKKSSFDDERYLAQGDYGIVFYIEKITKEEIQELEKSLNLKKIALSSLNSYFSSNYSLELEETDNIEELILTLIPDDSLQNVEYDGEKNQLFSNSKEEIDKIKNILDNYSKGLAKTISLVWKPAFLINPVDSDFLSYYQVAQEKMKDLIYHDNVICGTVA